MHAYVSTRQLATVDDPSAIVKLFVISQKINQLLQLLSKRKKIRPLLVSTERLLSFTLNKLCNKTYLTKKDKINELRHKILLASRIYKQITDAFHNRVKTWSYYFFTESYMYSIILGGTRTETQQPKIFTKSLPVYV